jgi:glucose-6-phosphate isomerase
VLRGGIGGSARGPQFISDALGQLDDRMHVWFLDNTDPEGIDRTLAELGERLSQTLTIVISKSGGTPETRNGMLETKAAYEAIGLDFGKHAVAVTGPGSKLDKLAESEGWITRFAMSDWVGGRTSVMSAVGLLPMALQELNLSSIPTMPSIDPWALPRDLMAPYMYRIQETVKSGEYYIRATKVLLEKLNSQPWKSKNW